MRSAVCSLPFSTSPDPVEAAAGTPCPGTTSEGDAAVGIAPFIDVERAESAVFLALRRLYNYYSQWLFSEIKPLA